jgi:hypothetical protein
MEKENLSALSLDELKKYVIKQFVVELLSIDYDGSCSGLSAHLENHTEIDNEMKARNLDPHTLQGWLMETADGLADVNTRQNTVAKVKTVSICAPLTTDKTPFMQPAIADRTGM